MRQKRSIVSWIGCLLVFAMFGVVGLAQEIGKTPLQRKNPIEMSVESINRGQAVFFEYCSGCHGQRADGRGPQALNLLPKPQNLRNSPFVKYLDDERLYTSISGGVRGTSMPAFEMLLNSNQRWDTINYIRSLSSQLGLNIANSIKKEVVNPNTKNPVTPTEESISLGRKLFNAYCMSCHGNDADGKGKTAQNLVPRPRNLVVITSWGEVPFMNYLSDSRVYDSIANGVAGTSMSPWTAVLTSTQIWNIINFLRAESKKEKTNYEQSYSEK
jgi:mono/diheme cytochrome c family protein